MKEEKYDERRLVRREGEEGELPNLDCVTGLSSFEDP